MEEIFNITEIISTYGYIGIFIIVFLESGIFFALPGDSLLFTSGILASSGILDIKILIPVIFISTFLGGILGYFVGIHLAKLQRYSFFRKILKKQYIEKAEKFYSRYGKLTIILSRFVPIVRTFAPIVAGLVRMNYNLFLRYSLISSFIWSFGMTLLGFFLGRVIPEIKEYMPFFVALVVLLSIVPVIWEFFKAKIKKE